MLKSMTSYGRSECRHGDFLFVGEIRCVNNRYRDVVLRMPQNYRALEEELKGIVAGRIRRGRIEVTLQMERNGQEGLFTIQLNEPLVQSYLVVFKQLADQFGLNEDVSIETLCRMKDVLLFKPEDVDLDAVAPGFREVMEQALDSVEEMREREGAAIESDFLKRLALLEGYVNEVEQCAPVVVEEYRKRLEEKTRLMIQDAALDEARLAQEVAFFAERCDITEELVRLKSHLDQFRGYLAVDDAVGRRLDFLIQEMNREVNTLGTKASDASVSKTVVEMKSELEKLREQVQNVE